MTRSGFDRYAVSFLAAMACIATLAVAAPQASAVQFGVVTAYTYSTPGGSVPTLEGGETSSVPGIGFSSADGAGDVEGFASAALLRLESDASGQAVATSPCRCVAQGVEIIMTAISQDVLTPTGGVPGQQGKLRVTLWLSGGAGGILNGVAAGLPVASRATLSVVSFDPLQAGDGVITTDPPGAGLAGSRVLQQASSNFPFAVDVPIRFGTPIGLRLKLIARAQGSVTEGSFQSVNGHSARFLTVQLLDNAGVPVSNPVVTSASGTPYVVVPEPSTTLGLASSILAVASLSGSARRRPPHRS